MLVIESFTSKISFRFGRAFLEELYSGSKRKKIHLDPCSPGSPLPYLSASPSLKACAQ
jgi:hypothetical protein